MNHVIGDELLDRLVGAALNEFRVQANVPAPLSTPIEPKTQKIWRAVVLKILAADPLRAPIEMMAALHPVVLYFETKTDADEFAALVHGQFVMPVEIKTQ